MSKPKSTRLCFPSDKLKREESDESDADTNDADSQVPNDSASCWILLSFLVWVFLTVALNYGLCSVVREPIPGLSDSPLAHSNVTFPIRVQMTQVKLIGSNSAVNDLFDFESAIESLNAFDFEAVASLSGADSLSKNVDWDFQFEAHSLEASTDQMTHAISSPKFKEKVIDILTPEIGSDEDSMQNSGTFKLYLFAEATISNAGDSSVCNTWFVHSKRIGWLLLCPKPETQKIVKRTVEVLRQVVLRPLLETEVRIPIMNPTLSLTLLNGAAESEWMFNWNVTELYSLYLHPFVRAISDVIVFNPVLDSQVLFEGSIVRVAEDSTYRKKKGALAASTAALRPKTDGPWNNPAAVTTYRLSADETKAHLKKEGGFYRLSRRNLQSFVGATDWNRPSTMVPFSHWLSPLTSLLLQKNASSLSTSLLDARVNAFLEREVGGFGPEQMDAMVPDTAANSVEFVVYIPPKSIWPLSVPSFGFVVPRFGGCVVYNPLATWNRQRVAEKKRDYERVTLESASMRAHFSVILAQMRSMLGLPLATSVCDDSGDDIVLFGDSGSGLCHWELDVLVRGNVASDLSKVDNDLSDMYEMLGTVSKLPLHKSVATLIKDANYAVRQTVLHCAAARFKECVQWSRKAHVLSHKAHFHPSLLPALYFSPEFTYAVYSPYFLPGFIPIVIATVNWLKFKFAHFSAATKYYYY